jgi:CRISPR-associated endonuclease/helicase Cas3
VEEGKLAAADFTPFFKAIWGFEPFPWQQRLLDRLAGNEDRRDDCDGEPGHWPGVLDLLTGAGKTAALDIAVFHLALDAAAGGLRRAPTRIAFIVDRRLIVDDAYERARVLAHALSKAIETPETADPVLLKVARSLRHLAGSGQRPLVVRRLRGGAPLVCTRATVRPSY